MTSTCKNPLPPEHCAPNSLSPVPSTVRAWHPTGTWSIPRVHAPARRQERIALDAEAQYLQALSPLLEMAAPQPAPLAESCTANANMAVDTCTCVASAVPKRTSEQALRPAKRQRGTAAMMED